MPNKYKTFEQLKNSEGTKAFKILFADRGSSIVIATPHGGKIEYGTSEITREISEEKYSYYIFEGKKTQVIKIYILQVQTLMSLNADNYSKRRR